jgi:hypothetical protein
MWQMANVREKAVEEILQLQDRITTDDQVHLLRLSTKQEITEIRNKSIQRLSGTFRKVELLQLGIELHVESLLRLGFKQLVESGISNEDAELLGRETTSKLLRIRDQYLQWGYCGNDAIIKNGIQDMFVKELRDSGWDGK